MSNALKKIQSWDGSGKPGSAPKPTDGVCKAPSAAVKKIRRAKIKVGDLVRSQIHKYRGAGEVLEASQGYANVLFGNGETDRLPVSYLTPVTHPLAKKLAQIVCHDNPNRTMHLGTTCQLSMTVKEFNDLMQKAATALNNGRKV